MLIGLLLFVRLLYWDGPGKGQRGCKEGKQKASPTAGWRPDLDCLGTVSLSCGHCEVYTKARKKCNRTTSVVILYHILKNESISGNETPLIYLCCTNRIVGIEEEQTDYDVAVVGGLDVPRD